MIYYKLIVDKKSIYYFHLIFISNVSAGFSNYELIETNSPNSIPKIGTGCMLADDRLEIITDKEIIKRLNKLMTFK